MAKVKETTDQYSKVRSEVTSKGSVYSKEAESKKQSILDTLETATKSLEFEEDTFKIDSAGWKKIKKGGRKVKINDTGDVIEYLEGPAKGEQIFITYDAFIREVCKAKNCSKEEAEKKYLMTVDEFYKKMKDNPDGSKEYKEFYNKEIKGHLAGYWHPNNEIFNNVGVRSDVWLVGGGIAIFTQDKWHGYLNFSTFGLSGRLLKN